MADNLLVGTPTTAGAFAFSITATTSADAATATLAVEVAPAPLAILVPPEGASLTQATVSAPYRMQLMATGGVPPYQWRVSSGTLPPGLSLGPDSDAIVGTPSSAGDHTLTVRVTDSSGTTASRSTAIRVMPPGSSPLAITAPLDAQALPDGAVGVAYAFTATATGGAPPYGWTSLGVALPQGLTLNSATGVLAGTPSRSTSALGVRLRVTDAAQATAEVTASLTIREAPAPTLRVVAPLAGEALPDGTVGVPYTFTFAAEGGAPGCGYGWSVSQGALPAGLSLQAVTGILGGTPSSVAADQTIRVQVSCAGAAGFVETRLTIRPAPQELQLITADPLPDAVVGQPYSLRLAASGGTPPYSWQATGGRPPGIVLDAAGLLNGTPTAVTNLDNVLSLEISSGATTITPTRRFAAVAVLGAPSSQDVNGTVGQAVSSTLVVTGGRRPYRCELVATGGTLPAGLSLSPECVISGTPLAPGSSSVGVRVQDASRVRSATGADLPQEATFSVRVNVAGTVGSLVINVEGLPSLVPANAGVTGPNGYATSITASQRLSGLAPGSYTISAGMAGVSGPAYVTTPAVQVVQVTTGAETNARIVYAPTDTIAQGVVDNRGGTITFASDAVLTVPPGAVSTPVMIRLRRTPTGEGDTWDAASPLYADVRRAFSAIVVELPVAIAPFSAQLDLPVPASVVQAVQADQELALFVEVATGGGEATMRWWPLRVTNAAAGWVRAPLEDLYFSPRDESTSPFATRAAVGIVPRQAAALPSLRRPAFAEQSTCTANPGQRAILAPLTTPRDRAPPPAGPWGVFRTTTNRLHPGEDMLARVGDSVYASASGTAQLRINRQKCPIVGPCQPVQDRAIAGYGYYVVITDTRGNKWLYGHLSQTLGALAGMREGESRPVLKGQLIAASGESGNAQGNPHLHFEYLPAGIPNPLALPTSFLGPTIDPKLCLEVIDSFRFSRPVSEIEAALRSSARASDVTVRAMEKTTRTDKPTIDDLAFTWRSLEPASIRIDDVTGQRDSVKRLVSLDQGMPGIIISSGGVTDTLRPSECHVPRGGRLVTPEDLAREPPNGFGDYAPVPAEWSVCMPAIDLTNPDNEYFGLQFSYYACAPGEPVCDQVVCRDDDGSTAPCPWRSAPGRGSVARISNDTTEGPGSYGAFAGPNGALRALMRGYPGMSGAVPPSYTLLRWNVCISNPNCFNGDGSFFSPSFPINRPPAGITGTVLDLRAIRRFLPASFFVEPD